jgi:hypothetical protein
MTSTPLPFPKTFRSRPTGRYLLSTFLMLIGGVCFLALAGVLLKPMITPPFLNNAPLFLLLGKILLVLLLFFLAGFLLRAYYLIRWSKLTLTPEGIFLDAVSFKMYTPWKNITGIGGVKYGIPFQGLALREPVLVDRKVSEGMRQGIAVIELTRLLVGKAQFKRKCPFSHLLPLDAALVGYNWLQGEFGAYLRQCAPQIFEHEQAK